MARPARIYAPGVPYHVVQRGVDRRDCFFEDHDRHHYLTLLGTGAARYDVSVHAYVLMTNHVHLLVTPALDGAVSRLMCFLGGRFVPRLNRRHGRSGHLWEGRHYSGAIESDRQFLACMRYVELNPVRAGLVRHPGGYRWSSYRHNAFGAPDGVITPHAALSALGKTRESARSNYEALVGEALYRPREALLENSRLRAALMRAANATLTDSCGPEPEQSV